MMDLAKDIKPISELKRDTSGIVGYVAKTKKPVLITQNGVSVAMVVNVEEYQNEKRKLHILEALAKGEKDVREGKLTPLKTVLDDLQQWLKK
jgi:prevent-host-death family protein